jgi:RNA polymerase sigma-70 factor (ECF subfamily)
LTKVPLRFRVPLVLHRIEGQSYQEIARVVGCREGTVKSRISRGRQVLKEKLAGYYQGGTS